MTKNDNFINAIVIGMIVSISACGGGGSKGADTSSQPTPPPMFHGVLNVPGESELGGTLLLTSTSGGGATGHLITGAASVVSLSGTSNNGFNVIGTGYTITATTASGELTGTATAPGGKQATVSAPVLPVVSAPPPSDPSGTYKGMFRINADMRSKNTKADGTGNGQCSLDAVIVGTLTMEVKNKGGGQIHAHLNADSVDTYTAIPPCKGGVWATVPINGSGLDFLGTPARLQFARVFTTTGNNSTNIRGETFIGVISGNSIIGTVSRSFNFTAFAADGEKHVESFPMSGVTVTLIKQ